MPSLAFLDEFPIAPFHDIDLNHVDPVRLANRLHQINPTQRSLLLINCQQLDCLRTHGVSHLVTQLLLTRQAGAEVLLYNVDAVLNRALRLLALEQIFRVKPALAAA